MFDFLRDLDMLILFVLVVAAYLWSEPYAVRKIARKLNRFFKILHGLSHRSP